MAYGGLVRLSVRIIAWWGWGGEGGDFPRCTAGAPSNEIERSNKMGTQILGLNTLGIPNWNAV